MPASPPSLLFNARFICETAVSYLAWAAASCARYCQSERVASTVPALTASPSRTLTRCTTPSTSGWMRTLCVGLTEASPTTPSGRERSAGRAALRLRLPPATPGPFLECEKFSFPVQHRFQQVDERNLAVKRGVAQRHCRLGAENLDHLQMGGAEEVGVAALE